MWLFTFGWDISEMRRVTVRLTTPQNLAGLCENTKTTGILAVVSILKPHTSFPLCCGECWRNNSRRWAWVTSYIGFKEHVHSWKTQKVINKANHRDQSNKQTFGINIFAYREMLSQYLGHQFPEWGKVLSMASTIHGQFRQEWTSTYLDFDVKFQRCKTKEGCLPEARLSNRDWYFSLNEIEP